MKRVDLSISRVKTEKQKFKPSKCSNVPVIHKFNTRLNRLRKANLVECLDINTKFDGQLEVEKNTECKEKEIPPIQLIHVSKSKHVGNTQNVVTVHLSPELVSSLRNCVKEGQGLTVSLPFTDSRLSPIVEVGPKVVPAIENVQSDSDSSSSSTILVQLRDLFSQSHSNPQSKPKSPQSQLPDPNLDVPLFREILSTSHPDIEVPHVINFDTLAERYGHEQALVCVLSSNHKNTVNKQSVSPVSDSTPSPVAKRSLSPVSDVIPSPAAKQSVDQNDSISLQINSVPEAEDFQSKVDRWNCVRRQRSNSLESQKTQQSVDSLAFDNHISTTTLSWETVDSFCTASSESSISSTDIQTEVSESSYLYPVSRPSSDVQNSNMGGSDRYGDYRGQTSVTINRKDYTTYSGDLSEDHNVWARGYRAWAESANLPHDEMCRAFSSYLKGDALTKYYTWPREIRNDYDALERTFLDFWGSSQRKGVWNMELSNLRQKPGEKVDTYIKKVCELGEKLGLEETMIVSALINGLTKSMKNSILVGDPKGLSETVMKLKILDRANCDDTTDSESLGADKGDKGTASASVDSGIVKELKEMNSQIAKQLSGMQESMLSHQLKNETRYQQLRSELQSAESARNNASSQQAFVSNTLCSHCNVKGHLLLDCQRYLAGLPAVDDVPKGNVNVVCNFCQVPNHQPQDCQRLKAGLPPVPAGQNTVMQVQSGGNAQGNNYQNSGYNDGSCYTCGSYDHIQRFCPQNRSYRGRGRGRGGYQQGGYYQQNQQHPQQQIVYQQPQPQQVVTVPQPQQVVTVPQPQQVVAVPQQVQAVQAQPQYVQLVTAAPAPADNK